MYGAEAALWDQWLKLHGEDYARFMYDVHVGRPWPDHLVMPERWRKGAEAVYLKRIDVVGYQPGVITVFEVKPHAGLGALGQILGYLTLYEDQFGPPEELRGAIVTELVDPNVEKILEDHGIELFVIPPRGNGQKY